MLELQTAKQQRDPWARGPKFEGPGPLDRTSQGFPGGTCPQVFFSGKKSWLTAYMCPQGLFFRQKGYIGESYVQGR